MRATTQFRRLLEQPGIIMAPGAYDCLTARLIENAGLSRGLHDRRRDLRGPHGISRPGP